jgi:hypothetical protein
VIRRSPHARRSLQLIACVCLAAQAFALAHLFLVVHERCDEHGEIEHGAHDAADGDHARLAESRGGGGHAEAGHDHCQTFAERRDVGGEPPVLLATGIVAIACTEPDVDQPRVATRPLYRLAPKASPPVVES